MGDKEKKKIVSGDFGKSQFTDRQLQLIIQQAYEFVNAKPGDFKYRGRVRSLRSKNAL